MRVSVNGMQGHAWENEYHKKKLVTLGDKPQASVLKFLKWLKKNNPRPAGAPFDKGDFMILDLGCGTGRNSNYLAERGNIVAGMEISETALSIAKARALQLCEVGCRTIPQYIKQSIGQAPYPFTDNHFDFALDVTSGNSLTEAERDIYLKETHRVLKPDGYFFVRTLCKEGDDNAKNLLSRFPGKEHDTYVLPDVGITERVFSREDFISTYTKFFEILNLDKETHYTRMNNRSYKRNFWIGYLQKVKS